MHALGSVCTTLVVYLFINHCCKYAFHNVMSLLCYQIKATDLLLIAKAYATMHWVNLYGSCLLYNFHSCLVNIYVLYLEHATVSPKQEHLLGWLNFL